MLECYFTFPTISDIQFEKIIIIEQIDHNNLMLLSVHSVYYPPLLTS